MATKYIATAHMEDGTIVTEANNINWQDVSSYIATWSRQMVQNVKIGDDVWDTSYYIQIHVEDK